MGRDRFLVRNDFFFCTARAATSAREATWGVWWLLTSRHRSQRSVKCTSTYAHISVTVLHTQHMSVCRVCVSAHRGCRGSSRGTPPLEPGTTGRFMIPISVYYYQLRDGRDFKFILLYSLLPSCLPPKAINSRTMENKENITKYATLLERASWILVFFGLLTQISSERSFPSYNVVLGFWGAYCSFSKHGRATFGCITFTFISIILDIAFCSVNQSLASVFQFALAMFILCLFAKASRIPAFFV